MMESDDIIGQISIVQITCLHTDMHVMAILHRPLGVTGPYTGLGGIIDLVKSLNGFNVDMGGYYNHLF